MLAYIPVCEKEIIPIPHDGIYFIVFKLWSCQR